MKSLTFETGLREKERAVYGDNIQPFAIRTDFSVAIINSCIAKFNEGMTMGTYIDHCYDIVPGQRQSFQDSHMTPILVCAVHATKMNSKIVETRASKRVASENIASVKHLKMRIVGQFVKTDRLDDAIANVKLAYITFMSECITPVLTEALECLSVVVNEFKAAGRETDGGKLQDDNDNDDHDHDDAEEEPFPLSKSCNKFKARLEKEISQIDLSVDQETTHNKYNLPSYMDYFCIVLIPKLPLWTRIMLTVDKNPAIDTKLQSAKHIVEKTLLDIGGTNAHVENYFSFVEQNFASPSVPIDQFIYKHFEDVQGAARQYINSVHVNSGKEGGKEGKISGSFSQPERLAPRYPPDADIPCEPDSDIGQEEEQWNKQPRQRKVALYQATMQNLQRSLSTPTHLARSRLTSTREKGKLGDFSKENSMRFQVFKTEHW